MLGERLHRGDEKMKIKSVLGDLQIVVERHSDVLRNNSLPFKILLVLRTVGFVLSYIHFARVLFWLKPIQLFSIEAWRILTSSFCGHNVLDMAWTVWSLRFGANLIRQNNSNETLLKVFAYSQVISTLSICVFSYVLYLTAGNIRLLYLEPVVGLVPINAAVLVLMKQFLPDSIVLTTPIGRMKNNNLPLVAVSITLVLALTGFTYFSTFLQCLLGVQVAWTYLRFFKPSESDAVFGDDSEHFAWASLFPARSQALFTLIGKACFRSLVGLKVCKRQVRHVDLNSLKSVSINMPSMDVEAKEKKEKRKAALKELNERLSKIRSTETTHYSKWDEDDDDEKAVPEEVVVEKASTPDEVVTASEPQKLLD